MSNTSPDHKSLSSEQLLLRCCVGCDFMPDSACFAFVQAKPYSGLFTPPSLVPDTAQLPDLIEKTLRMPWHSRGSSLTFSRLPRERSRYRLIDQSQILTLGRFLSLNEPHDDEFHQSHLISIQLYQVSSMVTPCRNRIRPV